MEYTNFIEFFYNLFFSIQKIAATVWQLLFTDIDFGKFGPGWVFAKLLPNVDFSLNIMEIILIGGGQLMITLIVLRLIKMFE